MRRRAPRVLMTADLVGGVAAYARDLCAAIVRAGGEVALVTMGPRTQEALAAELASLRGVHLFYTDYQLEWMDDPWPDVARAGELLLSLEREFHPDIVHLNGYAHGALPFRAPKLVVAHSCVLSWWQAVHGEPAPARYEGYRVAVERGLAAADAVVAPSATMLTALRTHYRGSFSGLVIHNGARVCPVPTRLLREGVCCAGRLWDPGKNSDLLIRAARGLAWDVELAGAWGRPGAAGSGAPPEDLPENVTLHGPLSSAELWQLFARSAVYVHPARYEPFGLSVLEAASAGCALVLADIPGLRELWRDAALFVDPDDPDQLRDTLADLRDDRATRKEWAARALSHADRYSLSSFEERYLRLYAALLGRKSARPLAGAPSLGNPLTGR